MESLSKNHYLALGAAAAAVAAPVLTSLAIDGRVWALLPGWRPKSIPDLAGKVAIVTGPTVNGIGHESACELAGKGAHVVLAGRSESKGQEALQALKERVPGAKAEFMVLDLASLQSVKDFAAAFKAKGLKLQILMNSAGVMANPFTLTIDGLESQFATNHLGHFLLTRLLLPLLEASAPARVVNVSSVAAFGGEALLKWGRLGLTDPAPALDYEHFGQEYALGYTPFKAYCRSKLANILFTKALARRMEGKQVYVNCCHPGGIDSNLYRHVDTDVSSRTCGQLLLAPLSALKSFLMLTPSMGAVTQLYLATSPEVEEQTIRGQYYRPQALRSKAPAIATEELEEKLWAASEKMIEKYV